MTWEIFWTLALGCAMQADRVEGRTLPQVEDDRVSARAVHQEPRGLWAQAGTGLSMVAAADVQIESG
jgi:hypothetical protein